VIVIGATGACNAGTAVLTRRVEAARLASALHLEFAKANEAANRAVLSDMDESSAAAADEAKKAIAAAAEHLQQLRPVLSDLGYPDEIKGLDTFGQRFAEYQVLEAEILPLAVENTNLKAQRLSFGPGQEAADAFSKGVRAAMERAPASEAVAAEGERSIAALLQIQVLQARHIAEADEAVMSTMEARMHESEGVARRGIVRLRQLLPPAFARPAVGEHAPTGDALGGADAALDRFVALNAEIVELSRKNTNVRSLALTLGHARVVSAACEDQLRNLEASLSAHAFQATR
jgi:hypothetical protein